MRVDFGKACCRKHRVVDPSKRSLAGGCPACESCREHERFLKGIEDAESKQVTAVRHRRGSGLGSVHDSTAEIAPEQAFALLAPPIPFQKTQYDVIGCSAGKLYFALVSCRRHLKARLTGPAPPIDEYLWYLTEKETERMLVSCGVDWMSQDQIRETHRRMDLNKSGSVNVIEVGKFFDAAISLCREIVNGGAELGGLLRYLLSCPVTSADNSLVAQLQKPHGDIIL